LFFHNTGVDRRINPEIEQISRQVSQNHRQNNEKKSFKNKCFFLIAELDAVLEFFLC
jgi:hypothetical protein